MSGATGRGRDTSLIGWIHRECRLLQDHNLPVRLPGSDRDIDVATASIPIPISISTAGEAAASVVPTLLWFATCTSPGCVRKFEHPLPHVLPLRICLCCLLHCHFGHQVTRVEPVPIKPGEPWHSFVCQCGLFGRCRHNNPFLFSATGDVVGDGVSSASNGIDTSSSQSSLHTKLLAENRPFWDSSHARSLTASTANPMIHPVLRSNLLPWTNATRTAVVTRWRIMFDRLFRATLRSGGEETREICMRQSASSRVPILQTTNATAARPDQSFASLQQRWVHRMLDWNREILIPLHDQAADWMVREQRKRAQEAEAVTTASAATATVTSVAERLSSTQQPPHLVVSFFSVLVPMWRMMFEVRRHPALCKRFDECLRLQRFQDSLLPTVEFFKRSADHFRHCSAILVPAARAACWSKSEPRIASAFEPTCRLRVMALSESWDGCRSKINAAIHEWTQRYIVDAIPSNAPPLTREENASGCVLVTAFCVTSRHRHVSFDPARTCPMPFRGSTAGEVSMMRYDAVSLERDKGSDGELQLLYQEDDMCQRIVLMCDQQFAFQYVLPRAEYNSPLDWDTAPHFQSKTDFQAQPIVRLYLPRCTLRMSWNEVMADALTQFKPLFCQFGDISDLLAPKTAPPPLICRLYHQTCMVIDEAGTRPVLISADCVSSSVSSASATGSANTTANATANATAAHKGTVAASTASTIGAASRSAIHASANPNATTSYAANGQGHGDADAEARKRTLPQMKAVGKTFVADRAHMIYYVHFPTDTVLASALFQGPS